MAGITPFSLLKFQCKMPVFRPVLNLMNNVPKEGMIMKNNTERDVYKYSDAQAVATILGLGLFGATVAGIVKIVAA